MENDLCSKAVSYQQLYVSREVGRHCVRFLKLTLEGNLEVERFEAQATEHRLVLKAVRTRASLLLCR